MDIEWAKDGVTGELFVVQARPETVHSRSATPKLRMYKMDGAGPVRMSGLAIGDAVAVGRAHVVRDPRQEAEVKKGDVLVTEITDPDWEPIMKVASAIVTDRGGRTSHAAIVARELGIPAIVGTGNATQVLADAGVVTVSCAEGETGRVYDGSVAFRVEEIDPQALPRTRTAVMLNAGDPDSALKLAMLPCDGVGLARMEFVFASWVGVHPLALTRYATLPVATRREVDAKTAGYADKTQYFVERLSEGVGVLAAAFWPRPVILRFSDFKTNEYARLLGGATFEPHEENPMLGWRGASRYYHPNYKEGFLLEVAAVKRVRETFGLSNLKVMIPFCRTPTEGRRVLDTMREGGLARARGLRDGRDPLERAHGRRVLRLVRRILDRLERPHPARPRRGPRLDDGGAALRRTDRRGQVVLRAAHRSGARAKAQGGHLRAGAERLPRVCLFPRGARDRLDQSERRCLRSYAGAHRGSRIQVGPIVGEDECR
jgi:pyruvate,water dikinase